MLCCPAHFPLPRNWITWFAFPALSKIVTAENFRPGDAGANSAVSLHFFFGKSCAGQVQVTSNSCGLLAGTIAIGFPKVIGGRPLLAGLLSVNFTLLTFPTFTLPKFSADGVTFSDSGTLVGVGVAVGVSVAVAVAVLVAVAVAVAVAVDVPVAVAV